VLRRHDNNAWIATLTGDDVLRLHEPDVDLPVLELYENVEFPNTSNPRTQPRPCRINLGRSATPVSIRQNFLATDKGRATARAGLRLVREIGNEPALAEFNAGEISTGPACRSNDEIDAHIRPTGIIVDHPLGTCKMARASDPTAVVDPEIKVMGSTGCASSTLRLCRTT
jgi:choline dehydrogenase-like flavoprotein